MTVACNKNQASISVNIENLPDSSVVLYKLNYSHFSLVDTIQTDANGHLEYKIELPNGNPTFYYLYTLDRTKLAGMILLPNDHVVINTNTIGKYTIEGSEESANLKVIDDALAETLSKMDKVLAENSKDANTQLSKIYVEHKRNMLNHISKNPHSITSATVLFQKINDQLPVFNENSDFVVVKSVYDSLKPIYPESEYITALMDDFKKRQSNLELENLAANAQYINFPELSLPDVNGNNISLSQVIGKVTILSFWTVNQAEHKLFNHELINLYEKYHSKGLEIYQVSLDEKPTWASTIKSQKLPWISVNDGLGKASPTIIQYNIEDIPTMYIIDKDGNISHKDIFDVEELERIIKKNIN